MSRSKHDVWRFTNRTSGEECAITPSGMLRGTSLEALLPAVLAGIAIAELPEFAAAQFLREKQLEAVLTDWRLPEGGLYFVTPSNRARAAKIRVLADFFISKLIEAGWRAD